MRVRRLEERRGKRKEEGRKGEGKERGVGRGGECKKHFSVGVDPVWNIILIKSSSRLHSER